MQLSLCYVFFSVLHPGPSSISVYVFIPVWFKFHFLFSFQFPFCFYCVIQVSVSFPFWRIFFVSVSVFVFTRSDAVIIRNKHAVGYKTWENKAFVFGILSSVRPHVVQPSVAVRLHALCVWQKSVMTVCLKQLPTTVILSAFNKFCSWLWMRLMQLCRWMK